MITRTENPQIDEIEADALEILSDAEIAAELAKEDRWEQKQTQLKLAKPCPFCGGEASYSADGLTHCIGCRNANCAVQPELTLYLSFSTVLTLVKGWNLRAA